VTKHIVRLLIYLFLDLAITCKFCVGSRLPSEARPSFVVSALVPGCYVRPAHTCRLHAGISIMFALDMIYNAMLFPATSLDLHNFCGPNSPLKHYIVHSEHYEKVNNSCNTNTCTVM
jgi:hypothetical protein